MLLRIRNYIFIADYLCRILGCRVALLKCVLSGLGIGTFKNCRCLSSVSMGNKVKSIGDRAFSDCISLKEITLPQSVLSIGDYAFCRSGLETIAIGEEVTNIGDSAFYGCNGLKEIRYAGTREMWGDIAFGRDALPKGVRFICLGDSGGPLDKSLGSAPGGVTRGANDRGRNQ